MEKTVGISNSGRFRGCGLDWHLELAGLSAWQACRVPHIYAVNLQGITIFQIWQRKNSGVTEPFDIQDNYLHLATASVSRRSSAE